MTLVITAVCEAIKAVVEFSHQLGDTIVFGFATSHTASIEAGAGMNMSHKDYAVMLIIVMSNFSAC